ncbi:MAG: class I SAM-dependent methyltransferase [Dehalococcoidia bacterium]|nr:class I SAM-dependent methyltransferase [Dehalococcoidia bacterium]
MYDDKVFDHIAESWYGRRHWPLLRRELEEMARRWKKGRLLNVGCAHGPDFPPFREGFDLWGVDISGKMLRLARKYSGKFGFIANLVLADARSLPFHDGTFDRAIAVASYHHIEGQQERRQAFEELRRVLKPGGEAFLTVWNRWQPRFWLKPKELMVPWRTKGEVFHRYYYLYSASELRKALTAAGFEVVSIAPEKAYTFPLKVFSRNICALVRKSET